MLERSLKSINENNDFKLPEIILAENDNDNIVDNVNDNENYLYKFSYIGDKNDLQYHLLALKKRAGNIKTIVNAIIQLESILAQEESRDGKTLASTNEENYFTDSRRNDKILDIEDLNQSGSITNEPKELIRIPKRRNDKYLVLDHA